LIVLTVGTIVVIVVVLTGTIEASVSLSSIVIGAIATVVVALSVLIPIVCATTWLAKFFLHMPNATAVVACQAYPVRGTSLVVVTIVGRTIGVTRVAREGASVSEE
jgi:hypothetical protein